MSGVAAVVAGAQTLMPALGDALISDIWASLVTKVAVKLKNQFAFRYQITRSVSQACNFAFPRCAYRRWLKSLTRADYSKPVEQVSVALTKQLDDVLSQKSKEWDNSPDHLSNALLLVEQTFPAIAATLNDSAYRQLTEQWAEQRSVAVRDQLVRQSGPDAGLNMADLSAVLLRRSDARRSVRLLAFDLKEANLNPFFEHIKVPHVPPGKLRILTGDFGVGKSEVAETWYRRSARALALDDKAPIPVWLKTGDLENNSLEKAINEQVGFRWRYGRGVDCVVDGLDETDMASAQAMLDQARELVRSFSNVRVLMTARPVVINPDSPEVVPAPMLSDTEASKLAVLAGATKGTAFGWSEALRTSIRRPFFALAAGNMFSRKEVPHGEADLIRSVVERALHKGSESASVKSDTIYTLLKQLAITLTNGVSVAHLPFKDYETALSSRLVTPDGRNGVTFSLPIFQQWFAAQAMLEGDIPAEIVVKDAIGFSHWRWAAAIALVSVTEQDTDHLDQLISMWITANPGAASWILKQAFGKKTVWNKVGEIQPDPLTAGSRLLKALRTWSSALRIWAGCVLPRRVVNEPIELGVAVEDSYLAVGLSLRSVSHDSIRELPKNVNPFQSGSASQWQFWFTTPAPHTNAWPWLVIQNLIGKASERALKNEPYLGGSNGVWGEERRYAIALDLTGHHGSLIRPTIKAEDLRIKAVELRDKIGKYDAVKVHTALIYADEISDIVRRLDDSGITEILSPLPAPNQVSIPNSGWVWDLFTEEELKKFEVETYARACIAYDEALTHAFSAFEWSMPTAALRPMGVILGLHYVNGISDHTPCLSIVRVPMALISNLAPTDSSTIWAASRRAVIYRESDKSNNDFARQNHEYFEPIRKWLVKKHIESGYSISWSESLEDSVSKIRPSVAIAVQWLSEDLKSLGLSDTTVRDVAD